MCQLESRWHSIAHNGAVAVEGQPEAKWAPWGAGIPDNNSSVLF